MIKKKNTSSIRILYIRFQNEKNTRIKKISIYICTYTVEIDSYEGLILRTMRNANFYTFACGYMIVNRRFFIEKNVFSF